MASPGDGGSKPGGGWAGARVRFRRRQKVGEGSVTCVRGNPHLRYRRCRQEVEDRGWDDGGRSGPASPAPSTAPWGPSAAERAAFRRFPKANVPSRAVCRLLPTLSLKHPLLSVLTNVPDDGVGRAGVWDGSLPSPVRRPGRLLRALGLPPPASQPPPGSAQSRSRRKPGPFPGALLSAEKAGSTPTLTPDDALRPRDACDLPDAHCALEAQGRVSTPSRGAAAGPRRAPGPRTEPGRGERPWVRGICVRPPSPLTCRGCLPTPRLTQGTHGPSSRTFQEPYWVLPPCLRRECLVAGQEPRLEVPTREPGVHSKLWRGQPRSWREG